MQKPGDGKAGCRQHRKGGGKSGQIFVADQPSPHFFKQDGAVADQSDRVWQPAWIAQQQIEKHGCAYLVLEPHHIPSSL